MEPAAAVGSQIELSVDAACEDICGDGGGGGEEGGGIAYGLC